MPSDGRIEALAERSALVREALEMARGAHGGQTRESGDGEVPFVEHLTAVAELLYEHGYEDELIAAGLLHDTIEHAGVEEEDLRARFGERIAAIVVAMSEDPEIESMLARKSDLRSRVAAAGPDARVVFAADKAANVASLRAAYAERGERVDQRLPVLLDDKILTWEYDLEMLFAGSPGVPIVDDLAAELLGLWQQRADNDERLVG